MTVLSTRWRFDNYTKKGEFYIEKKNHEKIRETLFTLYNAERELLSFWWDFSQKKIMKKFVKVCLHSSYTLQNSFHFDEILRRKYKIPFDAI